jgi:hypothetical protein
MLPYDGLWLQQEGKEDKQKSERAMSVTEGAAVTVQLAIINF